MRLRKKPRVDEALLEFDDLVINEKRVRLDTLKGHWREIFGNDLPIHAELGTGKGAFLSETASKNPRINFVGIELQPSIILAAAKKVADAELKNVRLVVADIAHADEMFAAGEIARLYINFCDPWPKRRHAKRRLTHRGFLQKYGRLLAKGGAIWFKTDNRPLFDFSLGEFAALGLDVENVSFDLHAENFPDNIMTEYEKKFSALGEKICRAEIKFP